MSNIRNTFQPSLVDAIATVKFFKAYRAAFVVAGQASDHKIHFTQQEYHALRRSIEHVRPPIQEWLGTRGQQLQLEYGFIFLTSSLTLRDPVDFSRLNVLLDFVEEWHTIAARVVAHYDRQFAAFDA